MRTSAAADGPLFSGSGRAIARRHLGPRLPQLAGLGALLLAATVLAVLAPQVLGRFVDAASGARPVGALLGIAGLYLLVALGAELFWVSADRLGAGVAWSAGETLALGAGGATTARTPVVSGGLALRTNLFGFAVLEAYYAYPFQRPDKGAHFGFQIAPGW